MAGNRVVQVTLPSDAEPTREDLELLEATFQAIAGLHFEGRRDWEQTARRLETEGWSVGCRLGWIAEARRGREVEQAFGLTRAQAFTELRTLTELDALASYSS